MSIYVSPRCSASVILTCLRKNCSLISVAIACCELVGLSMLCLSALVLHGCRRPGVEDSMVGEGDEDEEFSKWAAEAEGEYEGPEDTVEEDRVGTEMDLRVCWISLYV